MHGLPSVGLRLFNVHGPGQNPKPPYSGVISVFCERIRRRLPVEVFGDGHQTRDFVFVGDVVEALLRAMDARPAEAQVFNICTGRGTSVLQLAQTIACLFRQKLEVCFRSERTGEIRHSRGDPTAARQALGLAEPADVASGLTVTLAWLEASSAV